MVNTTRNLSFGNEFTTPFMGILGMLYYWVYHITLFFGANPMVSQVSDSFPNPNPAAF